MLDMERIPRHVAIIMDGNGRWAQAKGVPRLAGHNAGMKAMKEIVKRSHELGIRHLTVYAFSTENWKRPLEEVSALMGLFKQYLIDSITDFREDDIKVVFIGDKNGFDDKLRELINEAEYVAKDRKGMLLCTEELRHYADIIDAVKKTQSIMTEIDSVFE